jgi:hypothetical protein
MFEFDPKEAKDKTFICLPAGEYEAEIVNAENKVSKSSGNPMIELQLNCHATDGNTVRIFDYIVNPSSLWKLKSICRCCGMDFNEGKIDEQLLVGKRMTVKLKVRPATDRYSEKNEVIAYLEGLSSSTPTQATNSGTLKTASVIDDNVPF